MIGPANLDITIYQGSDFQLPFVLEDVDGDPISLSGASIAGKVRNDLDDASPILTFVGTVTDGANGEGQITATAAVTAAIVLPASAAKKRPLTKYVYDVEVTYSDGTVARILEGFCFFSPEVSK